MSEKHTVTRVTRRRRHRPFMVASSPFNTVKFELGVILVIGVLLLLLQSRVTDNPTIQFLLLSGYGLAGMGWLIFRTRWILIQKTTERGHGQGGPR